MQLSQEGLRRDFVAPALGTVTGEGGWTGRVYPAASENREGFIVERVLIRPDDNGPAMVVPRDLLQTEAGGFRLPLARRAAEVYVAGPSDLEEARLQSGDRVVVPVAEEYISVGKRLVETGNGVRVTKTVQSRDEVIEQPILRERVTAERASKNEVVSAAIGPMPGIRSKAKLAASPVRPPITPPSTAPPTAPFTPRPTLTPAAPSEWEAPCEPKRESVLLDTILTSL